MFELGDPVWVKDRWEDYPAIVVGMVGRWVQVRRTSRRTRPGFDGGFYAAEDLSPLVVRQLPLWAAA